MTTTKPSIGRSAILALMSALLFALPAVAGREKTEKTKPAPAAFDASQYVGSDTCKTCHEDAYKTFETTPHWKTTRKPHKDAAEGCEACHGPGKAHVDGG